MKDLVSSPTTLEILNLVFHMPHGVILQVMVEWTMAADFLNGLNLKIHNMIDFKEGLKELSISAQKITGQQAKFKLI